MAGNDNNANRYPVNGRLGGYCQRGRDNTKGLATLQARFDNEAEENEAMRRSWARAWLPWLVTLAIMLGGWLVTWGQTSETLDTNCRRLDRVERQMEAVGQDVSYMRGMMEREFGK